MTGIVRDSSAPLAAVVRAMPRAMKIMVHAATMPIARNLARLSQRRRSVPRRERIDPSHRPSIVPAGKAKTRRVLR